MTTTVMGTMPMGRMLTPDELRNCSGGEAEGWPKWLKTLGPVGAFSLLADNWADVKKGFIDGWNIDKQK